MVRCIHGALGFTPNNCLINFYMDGTSKMGYHSDQTDILAAGTGVVIISLGATRVLRFRNIADKEQVVDFPLPSGSLIYMTQELQGVWQHAIPAADTDEGRMSLTFRKMKED
ncbi:alpha-ketoglutarate-dependent dioxygenase AlkB [Chitinophaga agrisoli]|uniref:Alpha-ketoglutarate-dependent dioxygenase AlkB n=1 Tax=Chitinophaga agrisoli TaxID=2607653 RepID=A0A5B2VL39_9BACT|nr:alpha-ketoglutarate-dependent dioxygenase AlkB [Chitinophaga agrisoli]KAA2239012.1 alpha-ketoglutarate-dependent dioxygenase AlkB [Chitinophaga agrisoli]